MARIDDGHPTTITFSANASDIALLMWEKELTPPGISGGGPNETTTMRNVSWRTNAPKQLRTLTPARVVVAYDPEIYQEIVEMINQNQSIVIDFPDGSNLTFWGWIDELTPNPVVEGAQPTCDISIVPSNQDAAGAEIAPAYSPS